VLMDNRETTLANGNGDDYYLYRGIEDQRFVLIQHDLDSVFGLGQNTGYYNDSIFEATDIPAMKRFMEHPQFAARYYWHLKNLIETTFSAEHLGAFLDNQLAGFVPTSRINQMKDFIAQRNAYVLSLIPSDLTIDTSRPITRKRLLEEMLKHLLIVPEDVALHIRASARVPGWISVRLTETDYGNVAVDKDVVLCP
ncbi:unnamed protein product, partial [marine sediment metagenome]